MFEGFVAACLCIVLFIGGLMIGINGEDKIAEQHCNVYQKHEINGKVYECHVQKEGQ